MKSLGYMVTARLHSLCM